MVKYLPPMQETRVQHLGWEDPLEKGMLPTPVFLPGEFHGWRTLVGYSPWGCKDLDMTEVAYKPAAAATTRNMQFSIRLVSL